MCVCVCIEDSGGSSEVFFHLTHVCMCVSVCVWEEAAAALVQECEESTLLAEVVLTPLHSGAETRWHHKRVCRSAVHVHALVALSWRSYKIEVVVGGSKSVMRLPALP